MPGLLIRNDGSRKSLQATPEGRLEVLFKAKWPEVCLVIKDFASSQGVSPETLYLIIQSEAQPPDWRKWPKTWLNTTRPSTLLNALKPMYWEAFKAVNQKQVLSTIEEWNSWTEYSAAKMSRLVGKAVSVKKAYWAGKGFKDFFVIAYYQHCMGLPLEQQFTQAVKLLKDVKQLEPYLWHWVKPSEAIAPKVSKYKTIEITG